MTNEYKVLGQMWNFVLDPSLGLDRNPDSHDLKKILEPVMDRIDYDAFLKDFTCEETSAQETLTRLARQLDHVVGFDEDSHWIGLQHISQGEEYVRKEPKLEDYVAFSFDNPANSDSLFIEKRTSENRNWEDEAEWQRLPRSNDKIFRYHLTQEQAEKFYCGKLPSQTLLDENEDSGRLLFTKDL